MTHSAAAVRAESRWPGALAIVAVLALLALLPARISLVPIWVAGFVGVVILVPMAGAGLSAGKGSWVKLERGVTILFALLMSVASLIQLRTLMRAIVQDAEVLGGLELLSSSIAVWVINVLAASLLFWQIDRGGPSGRQVREHPRPDWLFPQADAAQDIERTWRPTYVDYLFLAYSTATAFSATDAAPLSSRAKILMMIESSISLMTIVVVVSRAINILGS